MSTRARRLAAAAATLALLGLVGAACSAGDSGDPDLTSGSAADGGSDSGGSDNRAAAEGPQDEAAPAEAAAADLAYDAGTSATRATGGSADGSGQAPTEPVLTPGDARSLVKKGNVSYEADDVEDARFQVEAALQARSGEVAESRVDADDDGVAQQALMTLRVPVDGFEGLMDDLDRLEGVRGDIRVLESGSSSVDVSDEVIDVDVRTELQRRSIDRISVLLDRATNIRDIVSIERELARREADLGSLQRRQAFLADQTSMSTVTISIQRPAEEPEQAERQREEPERTGFLGGLEDGWDAFVGATNGLLVALGALLPFLTVALLVGVPARLWWRRRRPALAAGPVPQEPQPSA